MEREVENMDSEDVGLGAASTLAGQVTPAQVTAPGSHLINRTLKSPWSLLGPVWEMDPTRNELGAPSSLASYRMLACDVTVTFPLEGGLKFGGLKKKNKRSRFCCFLNPVILGTSCS